ncbi:hypothetical protein OROGR_029029 [Orobanche gracilis]
MADPYRSREGLSTRSAAYGGNSDEVQVRIDPDFDEEVTGLRKQVRRLRDVAQEIETEAKFQNDFLNQLCVIEHDYNNSLHSSPSYRIIHASGKTCDDGCATRRASANDIDQSSGGGEKQHE